MKKNVYGDTGAMRAREDKTYFANETWLNKLKTESCVQVNCE